MFELLNGIQWRSKPSPEEAAKARRILLLMWWVVGIGSIGMLLTHVLDK
jgi:hypothetical protein